jgi:hypothetical protein
LAVVSRGGFYQQSTCQTNYLINPPRPDTYVDSRSDKFRSRRGGFYQPSTCQTNYLINPPRPDTYVDSRSDKFRSRRGGFYQPSTCQTNYLINPPRPYTYDATRHDITNAQCPMPNAQFPIPNSQFPIPKKRCVSILYQIARARATHKLRPVRQVVRAAPILPLSPHPSQKCSQHCGQ